jgi:hypothetical protein
MRLQMGSEQQDLAQRFVKFAVEAGVLRFGEFRTKAGRLSPYFFNSALFDDGAKLMRLAEFYARRLLLSGLAFDMLYGPAYKGITLASATAVELARLGRNVPFAHNRKERRRMAKGGLWSARHWPAASSSSTTSSPMARRSANRSTSSAPPGAAGGGADRARPDGAQRKRREAFDKFGRRGIHTRSGSTRPFDCEPLGLAAVSRLGRRPGAFHAPGRCRRVPSTLWSLERCLESAL